MSWPPIWQTPNQTQGGGTQTPAAMNMGMYQLTAEQQYALQQQNWQQWQIYQSQMAQWQAQYGEQVSEFNELVADNASFECSKQNDNVYISHSSNKCRTA